MNSAEKDVKPQLKQLNFIELRLYSFIFVLAVLFLSLIIGNTIHIYFSESNRGNPRTTTVEKQLFFLYMLFGSMYFSTVKI